jgi:uncharacterized protein HemX
MSRRFQFSVRALLVVTLLIAMFLGGYKLGVRHERQNRIDQLVQEQTKIRDALKESLGSEQKMDTQILSLFQQEQQFLQQLPEMSKSNAERLQRERKKELENIRIDELPRL